jgi:hypothetical protein
MSPGGHAATTVVASTATAFLSGSLPLATAVAFGGFFIDIDHALDYVLFNRQRDLRPAAFLRYYLEARPERVVLALHSWELFALLATIASWTGWQLLWGYLGGAAMHLLLDILSTARCSRRTSLPSIASHTGLPTASTARPFTVPATASCR